ncbi:MAG: MFS transporter, partial [Candidatus Nanopelagicales bacterium]
AYTGMVPDTVEDRHLRPANAYLSVASNSGLILGSALGGLLVALVGPGLAVAFDATTFLVSAGLVFTIRHLSRPNVSGDSMFGDLAHGWRVFLSYRWVVVIVAAYSVILMASQGAEEVLGPVIAVQEYGGPAGWAVVLSAQSAGLLAGAVAATRIRSKRPMVLGMLLTLTIPVQLMFLGLALPLGWITAGAFALGFSMEVFMVIWFTAMQSNIPRDALSRVSSYDAMGSLMLGPVGLALAGPLAAAVGLQTAFLLAATVALVAIAVSLLAPSIWRLRGDEQGTADPGAPHATT